MLTSELGHIKGYKPAKAKHLTREGKLVIFVLVLGALSLIIHLGLEPKTV